MDWHRTPRRLSNGMLLEEYAMACSNAIDQDASEWPIVKQKNFSNGYQIRVSHGYIDEHDYANTTNANISTEKHLTVMWVQDFPSAYYDTVQSVITSSSADTITQWDSTYSKATLVGSVKIKSEDDKKSAIGVDTTTDNFVNNITSGGGGNAQELLQSAWNSSLANVNINDDDEESDVITPIILWEFEMPPPFSDREILFVHIPSKETNNSNSNVMKQVCYACPSVSDEWVASVLSSQQESNNGVGGTVEKMSNTTANKVRSYNVFPSCDRITLYSATAATNNEPFVRVEHIITTKIGGSIPSCCFNNIFRSGLVDSYFEEATKFRSLVESSHNS